MRATPSSALISAVIWLTVACGQGNSGSTEGSASSAPDESSRPAAGEGGDSASPDPEEAPDPEPRPLPPEPGGIRNVPSDGQLTASAERSRVFLSGGRLSAEHQASFESFSARLDRASGAFTALELSLETGSVKIRMDDELTGYARSKALLDAEAGPSLSFSSTKLEPTDPARSAFKVTGPLELHGATKEVSFDATIKTGGAAFDLEGEVALDGSAYGLPSGERLLLKLELVFPFP